uniref:FAST kinase leucine-rich domain-containing protein n=1 Tax=Scylla olivacea TaxID=85551 RepID=A0A0P4WWU1_SCYOL
MLRALSRVILQPKKAGLVKCRTEVQICLRAFPEKSLCQSFYSVIPQKNAAEESLFSKKLLEYIRGNAEYAASVKSLPDRSNFNSTVNALKGHQLHLVIAHSSELKPNFILELFTHYASEKQNITQDIISKKGLMSMVKERVFQAIPLMTQNELRKFAVIIRNLKFERSRYLIDIAGRIVQECGQRAAEVALEQCLHFFDIMLILHGNNIYRKKQFDIFISLFEYHTATATPHQLVQILHYISFAKKNRLSREYVHVLIAKLEEVLEHLSFIDYGIALNGMFKCNVKLDKSSSLIKKTAKWLQVKAEQSERLSDLESFAFVAMVKVIRAAKYYDKDLLSSIGTFIMKSTVDTLQPEVIAHTLALYANSQVYDLEIFTKVESLVLQHLTNPTQTIRVKDISRILWSFSHVGHKGSDCFLDIIANVLIRSVHMGKLEFYPEHLSGSLFSMAVLGHYPKELIKEVFQPQKVEKLKGYQRSKQLSRLMALHQAVKIEVPEVNVAIPETHMNDLPKRTLSDEMLYRPALAHLMKGAIYINKSVGTSVLELKFPILFINHANLVFYPQRLNNLNDNGNFVLNQLTNCKAIIGEKRVAIEILDSKSLLNGSMDVIGIVKMKLRLMSQCGWVVHKLHENDISRFSSDEHTMGAFILDTLSKFKM